MARVKCARCGRSFDDKGKGFKTCFQCSQSSQAGSSGQPTASRGGGSHGASASVPITADCVFTTFYENGHLKRAIFIEAAQKIAEDLSRQNMTATSLRHLFHMLKSVAKRLEAERELDFGVARTAAFEFYRQVEYQRKRDVIKSDLFIEFVRKHLDVMTKDKKEFLGFVEYLTSVMAYMKQK